MSNSGLSRLLRPQSIAVVGGSWSRSVVEQCERMQYGGDLWPVHPKLDEVHGRRCYRTIEDLPGVPDAVFIGVNRHLTIDLVKKLSSMNAGGAVCFASGFSEAAAEDDTAIDLQHQLVAAAADMPVIGPNCYGLINYLDGALLWPDQHGGKRVQRGVAIITQSSNIAINITMQHRALPIAYVMTAGNQAKVSIAEMATALLDDDRVSAVGLHIEGFGDIEGLQKLAVKARERGTGIVVIKAGRTEQSQAAMVSHTNSLSGSDAAATALIDRLGFARVGSIPSFIESLKLLHTCGALQSNTVASMSCSGGEASLMADAIGHRALEYPALTVQQKDALRAALGPMVALANPLDYHTYIWNDLAAMTATFSAMLQTPAAMTFLVIDFPRTDTCTDDSWWVAIEALLAARDVTGATVGVLATLAENLPESVSDYLMQRGVPTFGGVDEALDAVLAASQAGRSSGATGALLQAGNELSATVQLSEYQSKSLLSAAGLPVAQTVLASSVEEAVAASDVVGYPLVIKVSGVAHKTEQGGVVLNVKTEKELRENASALLKQSGSVLIESFYPDSCAEILVGVVREADGLFKLTIGAGGVLTELMQDTASRLLPVSESDVQQCINELRVSPLLYGYRGQAGTDVSSVVNSVCALCQWVQENAFHLAEVEINPLLCLKDRAIVVDALISSSESFLEKL